MPVRPLEPSDLGRVRDLNEAAVPAVGTLDTLSLARLVEQSSVRLASIVEDSVVGFCLALDPGVDYGSVNYRWFGDRYDDFVYLDRVAIDPAFHGRGLGRELYAEVERRTGAAWFTLEVNLRPRNDASLAFHTRLGFTEVGQQETPYGTVVSLMAKSLTAKPLPRS